MSDIKKYGSTSSEQDAEDVQKCRHIVREVMSFGVNQRQILKLIELFTLELENRDHLQQLSGLIKRLEAGENIKSTLITEI